MNTLIVRPLQSDVTTPLIGDHSIIHQASHDTQHLFIKEEFRHEAWRLKRHWDEVTTRPPIRFVVVNFEISEQPWPKRLSASINEGSREVLFEHAIALLSKVCKLIMHSGARDELQYWQSRCPFAEGEPARQRCLPDQLQRKDHRRRGRPVGPL